MGGVGPEKTAYRRQVAQPHVDALIPPVDAVIARIARAQHGVVSRRQLTALGLTPQQIQRRLTVGLLHRLYAGVYAVGHTRLSDKGHWIAAVKACGPEAALSYRSAAALIEIRPTSRARIDVSSPTRRGRTIGAIDAHRADNLRPQDVETVDGIRCTSVARTLLDLTEVLSRREVERAIDQAEVRGRFDLNAIDDVLARANGRHGAPILQAILAEMRFATTITASELEERFLQICIAANLPAPQVNSWIALPGGAGYSPDFAWPERRLIVETDGRAYHDTHRRFEHDRRRDQLLTVAGWRVVRFTWRQVVNERQHVAATLTALLAYPTAR